MKTVLYISYDGMTDPLGQSQVIPYLTGLARHGHRITVLSCEKPHHFALLRDRCERVFADCGIEWHHVSYSKRPPVLSTCFDLVRMRHLGARLCARIGFDIVHCRTIVSVLVGQGLARKSRAKLIFDMRGLWADERVDGGLWKLSNPLYLAIYRFFKRKESQLFRDADLVITLTQRAKEFIESTEIGSESEANTASRVTVVPCCVDTSHFSPDVISPTEVHRRRTQLGLTSDNFVLLYQGSLGTRYMLPEMMRFFSVLQAETPDARFLLVTRDDPNLVRAAAHSEQVDGSALLIVSSTYQEIPILSALANGSIFFISVGTSGKAVSPTKQAELLAMGVPIVCNSGIGDCDEILGGTGAGIILPDMTDEAFRSAASQLTTWEGLSPHEIRQVALDRLSLETGIARYHEAWESLG